MNLDKQNKIKEWLSYAKDDLYAAEHFFKTMEIPVFRVVCFNAQQSAEKYLKAYQLYFDIEIIKTHSLDTLLISIKIFDEEIIKLENASILLTSYAVKYRYPDDFVDLSNEDAEDSIAIAKQIEKYITKKIIF
ncbi:MAG: HEPN domain-containing protein [Ferruginibacter sp.]|nr:HEPN domain-containing protein [Ferruginibacter sp.]